MSKSAIEIMPGKYIVSGLTYDTTQTPYFNRLTLLGLDYAGNLEWRKDYGQKSFEYLDGLQGGSAFLKSDTSLYATMVVRDSSTYVFGALLKMNRLGDTIWQRRYRDAGQDLIPLAMCKSKDGGFLLTGFFQNWTTNARTTLLIKTNSNGTELWRKELHKPLPDVSSGNSIIQDSVSGRIIIAGYQYFTTPTPDGFDNFSSIWITDSTGNVIAHKCYNNAGGAGMSGLKKLSDGNFLVSGMWNMPNYLGGTVPFAQALVVKFDLNGNQVWTKKLAPSYANNGLALAFENSQGNILMLGKSDTNYYASTQLFCFDASGTLKWQKVIEPPYKKIIFPTSFEPTSDGGFLIGNWITQEVRAPYKVIKIDSLGCDTTSANCIERALNVAELEYASLIGMEVFPNPSSLKITLSFSQIMPSSIQIKIIDITGMEVYAQDFPSDLGYTISVSELKAGLYFLQCYDKHSMLCTKKIVVEH